MNLRMVTSSNTSRGFMGTDMKDYDGMLRLSRDNLKRTLARGIAGTSGTTSNLLLAEVEHLIDAKIEIALRDYQRKPIRFD
jgi:hypothetical protein